MRIPVVIFFVLSLTASVAASSLQETAPPKNRHHFHGRTIDPFGWIKWLGDVPAPVRDIASDEMTDEVILNLCLSRMASVSGDALLYTVVKAGTAAYRLKKPHVVAERLNGIIKERVPVLWVREKNVGDVDEALIISSTYVIALCNDLSTRGSPKYTGWEKIAQATSVSRVQLMSSVATKIRSDRPLINYTLAVVHFLDNDYNLTRKILNSLVLNYPHEVGFHLFRAESFLYGVRVTRGDSSRNVESDSLKCNAILEAAHKKWPANPRIWYQLALGLMYTDKERARNLFTRYLAAKTETIQPERESAKRCLTSLSGGKSELWVRRKTLIRCLGNYSYLFMTCPGHLVVVDERFPRMARYCLSRATSSL